MITHRRIAPLTPALLVRWTLMPLCAISASLTQAASAEEGAPTQKVAATARVAPIQDPARVARLDANTCSDRDKDGRAMVEALQLESSSVPEVRLESQEEIIPTVVRAPAVVLLSCDLSSGWLQVQVSPQPGHPGSIHRLELHDVPPIARPRTAAVALLEWARSLLKDPTQPDPGSSTPAASSFEIAASTYLQPNPGSSSETDSPANIEVLRPETSTPLSRMRPPSWVIQAGVGFQMTHAPTPFGVRVDTLLDAQVFGGLRGSAGVHASHLNADERFSQISAWWWGGELALGYAWGPRAEISLWTVSSVDAIAVSGTNAFHDETARKTRAVASASGRFKAQTVLGSGLVLGVALDAGGFIQGARFTSLGEPTIELTGFRGASRVLVGYAF
jgi:hypothetical protein